ncbi:hypothetical protein BIV60_12400 [Bacillus sp. MUM 116]|uniref:hypothetical protein n=1 Tax=Bacillus sp. MUM 116 TaxID=1678002 RepID=UPI0008F5A79F|nr:hypothetical protein [Bacillus sp. MUM 116]OIK14168.1 hypothetical protein BIV60_12400 [Bacillus sp. MUM 116]
MKLFFVIILLAAFSFSLIIGIDILMGLDNNGVIKKALNPFRVMEPAEYIILIFFIFFFLINVLRDYLNKNKGNNPTSN